MIKTQLKRNSTYRYIFKPNITYYYDIDKSNIHNDIAYSHIIYKNNNKYSKIMSFTKYNFNRCFFNITTERKRKLNKIKEVYNFD